MTLESELWTESELWIDSGVRGVTGCLPGGHGSGRKFPKVVDLLFGEPRGHRPDVPREFSTDVRP